MLRMPLRTRGTKRREQRFWVSDSAVLVLDWESRVVSTDKVSMHAPRAHTQHTHTHTHTHTHSPAYTRTHIENDAKTEVEGGQGRKLSHKGVRGANSHTRA